MKKIILAIAVLSFTNQSFSQNANCDDVKKQNVKLIDKLLTYGININDSTTKVKSFNSDILINFIKCIGDKKNQTVTLYLTVTNNDLPNQNFAVSKTCGADVFKQVSSAAFDEIGQGFQLYQIALGAINFEKYNDNVSAKLSTKNTPLLIKLVFANVMLDTKIFTHVDICMKTNNLIGDNDERQGITELKNVKINWK